MQLFSKELLNWLSKKIGTPSSATFFLGWPWESRSEKNGIVIDQDNFIIFEGVPDDMIM
jgi:hypothetical protein